MRFSIPTNGEATATGGSWIRAEGLRVEKWKLPPVLIRLGIGDDNRLIVTGVLIEGDGELTARALRLPLGQIVEKFAKAASRRATYRRFYAELAGHPEFVTDKRLLEWRPTPLGTHPALGALAVDFLDDSARVQPVPRPRTGPKGHDDSFYREVAKRHRRLMRKQPRRPTAALAKEMGYSVGSAGRFVKEARKRGFLPA